MKKNWIFCALISFAIVSVSTICLSSEESRRAQRQPNRLKRMAFIPQKDQIVALSSSEENGILFSW